MFAVTRQLHCRQVAAGPVSGRLPAPACPRQPSGP